MKNLSPNLLFLFLLAACQPAQQKEVVENSSPGTSVLEERNVELLPIGSPAPDFSLPGIDGRTYSLNDFEKSDLLVIVFTCNHCPTAQAYEERLINLVEEYSTKGVGFVAISPNSPGAVNLSELGYTDLGDSFEEMKERAAFLNYNFPYLYDGDNQEVSIKYGPFATPHVFIFDRERRLQYSGRIDDMESPYEKPNTQDTRAALDALLDGREVAVKTTKTFGCSIKWAWKGQRTQELLAEWAKEPVAIADADLASVQNLIKNDTKSYRLINFWATWCGPCITEFPDMVEINRMYRNRNFELITISTDKPGKKEKALEILQKMEASTDNYIFTGEDIYALIEVVDKNWQGSLPYTMLIAPGGEVVYRVEGEFNDLELKRNIVKNLGRYFADDK